MLEAKTILAPHWVETYKNELSALALQLAELNTNLFLLDKITKFNFNLFGDGHNTFWFFITNALFESCIMCSWRMAIDTDTTCLTAAQLKNAILKNIIDTDVSKQLKRDLKKVDFDKRIKQVSQKIKDVRHTLYGHLNKQTAIAITTGRWSHKVSLNDLKMVRDTLNDLIQALSFDTTFKLLPLAYDPSVKQPLDTDARPDIEQILDHIAFKSYILNLPDKQPEIWNHMRNKYSKAVLQDINRYRNKFDFPQA